MRDEAVKFVSAVLLLLIGAGVGYVLQTRQTAADAAIRYLDVYQTSREGLLSAPELQDRKLEILLDGKPLSNLSEHTVILLNFSDRNFADVPIYVELSIPPGSELLTESVLGPQRLPEAVDRMPVREQTPGRVIRRAYVLRAVNRSTEFTPVFQASYVVRGSASPEARVTVAKVGLEARNFTAASTRVESWWRSHFLALGLAVLGSYLVAVLSLWRWLSKRENIRTERAFRSTLDGVFTKSEDSASDASVEDVISAYWQARRELVKGRLFRWLEALDEPGERKSDSPPAA